MEAWYKCGALGPAREPRLIIVGGGGCISHSLLTVFIYKQMSASLYMYILKVRMTILLVTLGCGCCCEKLLLSLSFVSSGPGETCLFVKY